MVFHVVFINALLIGLYVSIDLRLIVMHYLFCDPWGVNTLTLGQCTLDGPVFARMPLVDPMYHGIRLSAGAYTCRVHWNITGKAQAKLPHTGMPLDKL